MESCCRREAPLSAGIPCPANGVVGRRVPRTTVQALVTSTARRRLDESPSYCLCADPACDVVYYSDAGEVFTKPDIEVAVACKEPVGQRVVCYCFGESDASIADEIERTGTSRAEERIRAHIIAGECACETQNPTGVCCLGEIRQAVRDLKAVSRRAGSQGEVLS